MRFGALLAWALVALGCGSSSGSSAASVSATASARVSAAPLATLGTDGHLVLRDGRTLLGGGDLREVREAVFVHLTREKVHFEDVAVDDVPALSEKLRRADGLFEALRRRREEAKIADPGRTPSDVVILEVDEDVPATAVKSVFQTCGLAGYPHTLFAVMSGDAGTGR